MSYPDGLTEQEYHAWVVREIAPAAIKRLAAEIIRAADEGQPPLAILVPDLDHLISENYYWRQIMLMIEDFLGPNFEKTKNKRVPQIHSLAPCYVRISPNLD